MKFKKNVKSALALTLILGGAMLNSNIVTYADTTLESNTSINLENSKTRVNENGSIVIENEDTEIVLTPISYTVEDKNGEIKELNIQTRESSFSVELQSTVTKKYAAKVSIKHNGSLSSTTVATADVNIKVKCTGNKTIQATSNVSNLKGHNGYTPSSSTTSGKNASISLTSAKIGGSKVGSSISITFNCRNTVTGDAGSAQGYLVKVRQEFYN